VTGPARKEMTAMGPVAVQFTAQTALGQGIQCGFSSATMASNGDLAIADWWLSQISGVPLD